MQIGEVAERIGLSLRTIRYYEEVGLVVPSVRSQGGFRLYTEPECSGWCDHADEAAGLPAGRDARELLGILDSGQ